MPSLRSGYDNPRLAEEARVRRVCQLRLVVSHFRRQLVAADFLLGREDVAHESPHNRCRDALLGAEDLTTLQVFMSDFTDAATPNPITISAGSTGAVTSNSLPMR